MANMTKTERGILIMVFIRWTAHETWEMEEADLEKQLINHLTPENLKKFQKKTPTSNVILHRKLSAVDLFLITEGIVWNEGATKNGRGCGTSWVTNHK